MPKLLPWICVMANKPKPELDAYLAVSKTMVFRTSNRTNGRSAHRLISPTKCSTSSGGATRPRVRISTPSASVWRSKVDSVEARPTSSPHIASLERPRSFHAFYTREMAKQEKKPARIRNSLIEALKLGATTAPKLTAVQNCLANNRRTHMSNTDLLETLDSLAQRFLIVPTSEDHDPIAVGFDRDARSLPAQ